MQNTPRVANDASRLRSTVRHRPTAVGLTCLLIVALLTLTPAMATTPAHAAPTTANSSKERLLKWIPSKEGAVFLRNVQDRKKIPGAPRTFRNKLHRELRSIWKRELGGVADCKQVAGIHVWSLRSDGYAIGNVVSRVADTGCQAGASGAVVFWIRRDGDWRRAIESADIVECRDLKRIAFPSELGVDRCFDGTEAVDYHQD